MTYQSVNPFTGEVIETFPDHTDAELEGILAVADAACRTDWRLSSYADRAAVVGKAAAILREQTDRLAAIATREMGKLLHEAREEVLLSADILDHYADNAGTMLKPRPLPLARSEAVVESQPVGVIFAIEPWNFPYYQLARLAGPNLMAGNTLVVKHAPGVPRCALEFAALFPAAGAPAGVYANVFLSNEQSAAAIADWRVKGVALTGSERAGAAVAAAAGRALKKSTMELGGSDAFIVLDDADLDVAVRLAVQGRMNNMGQACAGSKQFSLHDAVADAFLGRFRAALDGFAPGDPMDPASTLAPLCSQAALDRALGQIDAAVEGRRRVVSGGKRLPRPTVSWRRRSWPTCARTTRRSTRNSSRPLPWPSTSAARPKPSPWPMTPPTAWAAQSSRPTRRAAGGSRRSRWTRAWCSSTTPSSPRPTCRSAAPRTRASGASCPTSASTSSSTRS